MATLPNDIIESEIKPLVKDGDWESLQPGEESFSTNQLIAAYEAGKTKGMMGADKLLMEKIVQNVNQAGVDTKALIDELKKRGLTLSAARLKVISWDQYEVLLTLPEEEFVREGFEDVYELVGELENTLHHEHYCIAFRFCPESEGFDEKIVITDGFNLQHKSLAK